jgi:hypothetical protein
MASNHQQSLGGRIFLTLFSLPFLGVGVLMTYMTLSTVFKSATVQGWRKVPTEIQEIHVEELRGSDSTTYQLQAKYTYQIDGRDYTGTKVGIHGGADNIGRWHHNTLARLEADRDQERAVAYVNPKDPNESYLAPDLRPGMVAFQAMFGVVFGAAGAAMLFGVAMKKKKTSLDKLEDKGVILKRREPAAKAQSAVSPYRQDPKEQEEGEGDDDDDDDEDDEDWEDDEDENDLYVDDGDVPAYSDKERILKYNPGKSIAFMAFFSLIWNGISWTLASVFFYQMIHKDGAKEPMIWVVLIFPLIGLFLIWSLVTSIIRNMRYGVSTLELATMPGVLGGKLSGAITCKGNLGDARGVEVSLSCVKESVTTDSDGDRRTSTTTQWNDSYELRSDSLPRVGGTTTIPVLFAVPYDQPMTGGSGRDRILWKVSVAAARPGADYDANWEVPVYRTKQSQRGYRLEENPLTSFMIDPSPEESLNRNGVTVRTTAGGGKSWYFRPTPIRSGAPGCLIFVGILGAILAATLLAKAQFIVVAIVGLLLLLSVAIFFHMLLGRAEIRIENGVLTINGGFAGFNSTKTFPLANVQSVNQSESMTSGDSVYYKLEFAMADGTKVRAGNQLKGQRLMDALKDSIDEELKKAR